MCSAIAERWQRVRAEHRAALIPYLTAGYPSREESLRALRMFAEAGADFVELGMPFSDPLADGPVIQQSTQRALENGMSVRGALELVREADLDVPVIAFGYLNPILAYGPAAFLRDAADAGVSGLLLTDLPAGEDADLEEAVRSSPLDLIRLVAPTTEPARLRRTLRGAEGFVYLISRLGVTGPETRLDEALAATVARIRAETSVPVALGFGIATPEQAAQAARLADGVVVGSALIGALAHGLPPARQLLLSLRDAVRAAGHSPAGAGSGSSG